MAKERRRGSFSHNKLVKTLSAAAVSGAAVLWSFLPDDGSPAAKIHHYFRREVWRERGLPGRLVLCAGFLVWLPATFALLLLCTLRCGRRVRSRTGKKIVRQAAEQLLLACTVA